MRLVIQRVASAQVTVEGSVVGTIGRGLLVYVGVAAGDADRERQWRKLAEKVAQLRVFEDDQGKLNCSVQDCGGAVLVVPNFTLLADATKGRRPSFVGAAGAEEGKAVFDAFTTALRNGGCEVGAGEFGAHMIIRADADGPVNIVLETLGGPVDVTD